MLYNSIYIYLYMYTGAPRLGSARRECYFCMSVACRMVLRCGKFDGLYQGFERMQEEVWWHKKIKLQEREIMFVSSNLLWMDFSATRMFTEGYRLVRWKEWGQKREKTELVWFKCRVDEVGEVWEVTYQLGMPECELQFCFFEALTVRSRILCKNVLMCHSEIFQTR